MRREAAIDGARAGGKRQQRTERQRSPRRRRRRSLKPDKKRRAQSSGASASARQPSPAKLPLRKRLRGKSAAKDLQATRPRMTRKEAAEEEGGRRRKEREEAQEQTSKGSSQKSAVAQSPDWRRTATLKGCSQHCPCSIGEKGAGHQEQQDPHE